MLTYADRRPALPRLLQDLRRPTALYALFPQHCMSGREWFGLLCSNCFLQFLNRFTAFTPFIRFVCTKEISIS